MRKPVWIGVGVVAIAAALLLYVNVHGPQRTMAELGKVTGSAESRELDVAFGPCGMRFEISTDEASDTVTVRVLLDGHRGSACTAEAAVAKVTLKSPLGERRVVDAATGRTVRVEGRD